MRTIEFTAAPGWRVLVDGVADSKSFGEHHHALNRAMEILEAKPGANVVVVGDEGLMVTADVGEQPVPEDPTDPEPGDGEPETPADPEDLGEPDPEQPGDDEPGDQERP